MGFFSFLKPDYYQCMTEAVNEWWNSFYRPDDYYDRIDMLLSVHVCGSEKIIEEKASAIAGYEIDYHGTAGLAFWHEGRAHIFILSTASTFAQREMNYFTAGHELAHLIDMYNEAQQGRTIDYLNPDEGRN